MVNRTGRGKALAAIATLLLITGFTAVAVAASKSKRQSAKPCTKKAKKKAGRKKACRRKRSSKTKPKTNPVTQPPVTPIDIPRPESSEPVSNTPSPDATEEVNSCDYDSPSPGTVQTLQLNEISGIEASSDQPGTLWVHNDSGDGAKLYALTTAGELAATVQLSGVTAVDWEDIALFSHGGSDYLYIADIGDNQAARNYVTVYRIEEPTVEQGDHTVAAEQIGRQRLTYPGGARDAETLLADPASGDLYLVSKRDAAARVYRFDAALWGSDTQTVEYVRQLGFNWAVGGDVSSNGDVLIKDAGHIYYYPASGSVGTTLAQSPTELPYTAEPQGEAIAFCHDDSSYFTVSEGINQPIYFYPR